MSTYLLIGYSETRDFGRVRVYIGADQPVTAHSPVYVAKFSNRFDYNGQPLGLQRASTGLAARVRAHLLGHQLPSYVTTVPFEPLTQMRKTPGKADQSRLD